MHAHCRLGQRHDDGERGTGALLTILAMADADESRLGVGRIAHFAAKATTFDLHPILLRSPRQDSLGGSAEQRS